MTTERIYESEHVITPPDYFDMDSDTPFVTRAPSPPQGPPMMTMGIHQPSIPMPVVANYEDAVVEDKIILKIQEYKQAKARDSVSDLVARIKISRELGDLVGELLGDSERYRDNMLQELGLK